jgi:hypothetical protein
LKGGITVFRSFEELMEMARSKRRSTYFSAQEIVDYLESLIASGWLSEENPCVSVDVLGQWMEIEIDNGKKLSYGRTSNRNALTKAVKAFNGRLKRELKPDAKLSFITYNADQQRKAKRKRD